MLPTVPALGLGAWSLLSISTSAPVVIGLWVVTLLGAIGVMIGFRTRLAAILLFVGVLSFERRDPYILNAGDSCCALWRSTSCSPLPARPCRSIGGAARGIGSGSSRSGRPGHCA